jgi:2-succinyl-5-enolpyruvyl-6-hydroxy-3-cyclohexene-1-carboxylate synthase
MSAGFVQSEWARLLVESLAGAGVRDVVVSPGSRSTPFVAAALRSSRLRCHVVVDERSAAFFALGQAKLCDAPSLLVCTSGSAGTHYLPALIEATHAGAPMIVLTADRPFRLQDAGAPQTIDQTRLFGAAARFVELGEPRSEPQALEALARVAAQAVYAARFEQPVHLNARALKPLEPVEPRDADGRALRETVDAILERGATRVAASLRAPDAPSIAALAERCRAARRGIIACGPMSPAHALEPEALAALGRTTGFVVLAEAASQVGFSAAETRAFDLLLRAPRFRDAHAADLVLQLGAAPTSSGFAQYLDAHSELERDVIAPFGWPDPASTARSMIFADLNLGARALADALRGSLPHAREREAWRHRWSRASQIVERAVDAELAEDGALSEGGAVRVALEALPERALLCLGNSLPIREADTFRGALRGDATVVSQRGASGIDGAISWAAGAASVAGRPALALIGDLSFLHDIGGLAAARTLRTPLAIVVVNNGGGRIFEQLPVAGAVSEAELAAWTTPHDFDLSAAARLFGLEHRAARTPGDLAHALARALDHPVASVVEAIVPAHSAAEQQRRLLEGVAASLAVLDERPALEVVR